MKVKKITIELSKYEDVDFDTLTDREQAIWDSGNKSGGQSAAVFFSMLIIIMMVIALAIALYLDK